MVKSIITTICLLQLQLQHTIHALGLKEERVLLLERWRNAERSFLEHGEVSAVDAKFPRKIKMRRMATAEVKDKNIFIALNSLDYVIIFFCFSSLFSYSYQHVNLI